MQSKGRRMVCGGSTCTRARDVTWHLPPGLAAEGRALHKLVNLLLPVCLKSRSPAQMLWWCWSSGDAPLEDIRSWKVRILRWGRGGLSNYSTCLIKATIPQQFATSRTYFYRIYLISHSLWTHISSSFVTRVSFSLCYLKQRMKRRKVRYSSLFCINISCIPQTNHEFDQYWCGYFEQFE